MLSRLLTPRSLIILAIFVASTYFTLSTVQSGRLRTPRPFASTSSPTSLSTPGAIITDQSGISALCLAHRFSPFPIKDKARRRKIYDLLLLSTELDWLEIRLYTLSPHVDYFIVVESPTTFTGLPKPLYLQENWSRFSAFHHQIIHRVVEDPGAEVLGTRTWSHEDFMRNALFEAVFPGLKGDEGGRGAEEGDVLLVSDVDEIPKPDVMPVLRYCDFPARLTLQSHFYYYSFQWLHRGEHWAHPQVTVYRGLSSTILPKDLRNGEPLTPGFLWLNTLRAWWEKAEIMNAGWHCSSCFSTVYEMKQKMESFSHQTWNTEGNRETKTIVERVRNGLDLFGRETEIYDRVEGNRDLPQYILEQGQRLGYLVDRDGENAGFMDVMARPLGEPALAGGG